MIKLCRCGHRRDTLLIKYFFHSGLSQFGEKNKLSLFFFFGLYNCISCRHTVKMKKISVSLLKLLWPRCLDLYFKKLRGFALLYLAMGE